jgi:hypothetical protein
MLHPGWLAASGAAIVLLVALYYGPGWLGAVLFALIAVWITTGTPEPMAIVATACDDLRAFGCTPARDVAPARLFVSLAELIFLIVLIAALAQWLGARGRR